MRCSRWLAAWELHADDRARQICFERPGDRAVAESPSEPPATEAVQTFPLAPMVSEASHERPQPAQRSTAAVVVQSLMWLWLIFLSVLAALGYQALSDQADQERLDSRLQRLEAQATGLAETIEAIQQRPAVATDADLKHPPDSGSTRGPGRKSLSGYAAADDLQALRAEVERSRRAAAACHRTRPAARIAHVRRLQDRAAAAAIPRRRRRTARRPAQRVRRAEHRGLHARNFRCCCPGMRSARGACRRSRATPQCSRPATRPAAWRFPDRSTP